MHQIPGLWKKTVLYLRKIRLTSLIFEIKKVFLHKTNNVRL